MLSSISVLNFSQLSNEQLISICREQHSNSNLFDLAWVEFKIRFDQYIRLYIKKTIRMVNPGAENYQELLEDLIQEVYLKLLSEDCQALKEFRGGKENSFLAYLARISANIVMERGRRGQANKRRAITISIEKMLSSSESCSYAGRSVIKDHLSHSNDPISTIYAQEIRDLLEQVLTGPNRERDKQIFELWAVDGFTYQEIAHMGFFSLQETSIDSIIRRTRSKLLKALKRKTARYPIAA